MLQNWKLLKVALLLSYGWNKMQMPSGHSRKKKLVCSREGARAACSKAARPGHSGWREAPHSMGARKWSWRELGSSEVQPPSQPCPVAHCEPHPLLRIHQLKCLQEPTHHPKALLSVLKPWGGPPKSKPHPRASAHDARGWLSREEPIWAKMSSESGHPRSPSSSLHWG